MNLQISPLEKSVTKTVNIPGSKSYTNRSLIIAALTKGKVVLKNPLFSDDTGVLINCLKKLGINIKVKKNEIVVVGDISQVNKGDYDLNVRISGTTIRFLLALCCIVPGTKKLYGDEGLNKRPIGELVTGLMQLGSDISYLGKEGFPPLLIKSQNLKEGTVKIKGGISSQFFSALLMVAPLVGIRIKVLGEQISKPYIDMTIDTMEKFGVNVVNKNYNEYIIDRQSYKPVTYLIEGDYSSAGYFFAIAALTKSKIIVKSLNPDSKQADIKFLELLKKMGNLIIKKDNEIEIEGKGVKAVKVDMKDFPDQVQTLVVLAAFADGLTVIDGVKSLRVKETERVLALQNELSKMGIKTKSTNDRLMIYGGNPKAVEIETYEDHRMAMSFAIAGAKLDGMVIKNAEVVTKTFPQFWQKLETIGVGIKKYEN